MYVEISPRQSGKTTRLIQAASDYLRHNPNHSIAVVGINSMNTDELRNKFLREGIDISHINFMSGYVGNLFHGPNYWFFDEFGFMENILHPIFRTIIENGYYCTTPAHTSTYESTNSIVEYCRQNNIQIHFNNPWTEERIQEQGNWNDYTRESVLGDWVRFMESKGLFNGIKINLIRKEIRKHRFTSW